MELQSDNHFVAATLDKLHIILITDQIWNGRNAFVSSRRAVDRVRRFITKQACRDSKRILVLSTRTSRTGTIVRRPDHVIHIRSVGLWKKRRTG